MGRRSKSPIEMLLAGATRLGWPVGIAIAAAAFVLLRWLSFQSPATVEMGEGFGSALAWNVGIQIAAVLQWLLPAMILVGVLVGSLRRRRQSRLVGEMRQSGAAGIKGLSWKQFEELMAGYFRDCGFTVLPNHDNGPDGGIDLWLRRGNELHLVQCKHWRARKVPVSTVRELFGVMAAQGAVGGFVVTSGEFTADAVEFAEGRNIELIDGATLQARLKSCAVVHGARPTNQQTESAIPECPRCGSRMISRTARRGTNAGSAFWGCSKFPGCRGIRAIGD